MATQTSIWQRVGTIFRGSARTSHSHGGNGNGTEPHPSDPAVRPDIEDASPLSLRRFRRRPSSADLQERYERVGRLLDSLSEHFDVQDQRSKELGDAVSRMADVFEQLPEAQRTQADCMQSIASHLSTSNRQSSEMKDTLARVPSAIQAQAEAIHAVSRQMGASSKTDTQMIAALQRLSRVVGALGIASRTQIDSLKRMEVETTEQRAALADIVRDQNRWMVVALVIAGIVAIGAIAALLIAPVL